MNDYGDSHVPGDEPLGPWYENARSQIRTPATALQWYGIVLLVFAVLGIVIVLVSPDLILKAVYDREVKANRERPPENRVHIGTYDEFVKTWSDVNLIWGLVELVCGFMIFFGGSKMKQLEGYSIAIVASVIAILPCNRCCCIGAIFGIWSLIVLLSSDAKLAFARTPAG
jgi:hypothetical protein